MPDGTNLGSVVGHQHQYEGWREHPCNLIAEWDDDYDCNSTGLRVPRDARPGVQARARTQAAAQAVDGTQAVGPPGCSPVGAAAKGAAIGAGVGLVLGGIVGAIGGGVGGTFVAHGVATIGGGGAGAVAGAEAGEGVGAAIGAGLGGLIGWLLED